MSARSRARRRYSASVATTDTGLLELRGVVYLRAGRSRSSSGPPEREVGAGSAERPAMRRLFIGLDYTRKSAAEARPCEGGPACVYPGDCGLGGRRCILVQTSPAYPESAYPTNPANSTMAG